MITSAKPRWRKLVAGGALVVAILLSARTCTSELADAELVFVAAEGSRFADHLRVELFQGNPREMVGYFERRFDGASDHFEVSWPLQVDVGNYRLTFQVHLVDGETVHGERDISIDARAKITVDLSRDLRSDQAK